jgi:sulfate permease, SulP family
MPVGGSVSATSLNKQAGARSRLSLLIASLVMVLVIFVFGDVVGNIAMPALAGLLIIIGVRTVRPVDVRSVWQTGVVQRVVLAVTLGLTILVPLHYAVLLGVGLSIVLHVVRQSSQVSLRRQVLDDAEGHLVEVDPPGQLPGGEVVVLQPYGSLFFAAAPVVEAMLLAVGAASSGSVVILRLRGRADVGTTFHAGAPALRDGVGGSGQQAQARVDQRSRARAAGGRRGDRRARRRRPVPG